MARKPVLVAAAVMMATTVVAALSITPATAHTPGSVPSVADGVAPDMLGALARDLRISPDQARQRLARENTAARAVSALRATFGAGYGGAWLNGDATTLTVGVTDGRQAALVRAAGATPKPVTRTEAQLDAVQAGLDAASSVAPGSVPGWYVDIATNSVVVSTRAGAGDAARAFVAAAGVDARAVRYAESTESPRPLIDVIGGNAYYIGSGSRCSVGFSVTGGFVTAGHCGTTGASTTQPSGTFRGSTFPGRDYAWVQVAAGNTPRAQVNRYPGTVTVNGSTEAAVGASVCRSGSTTGWHCGTIQQKNASVTYAEGTVNGLTRTNACAEPGDSGGSWLAGDQAQGVTSGGSGNCTSGGTMYFQPVNPILAAYGLTLLTGGGTPPTTPPTSSPPGGGTWAAYTAYATGASVTYGGGRYVCLQGHTSMPGWEPPNVPALWRVA
ncbi:alpha-lytic protease prodomain-containing protein [Longispora sp. K20-0274]|uniref:alpha-lytic protease prodomain-containing protein n=1 Tax=Longispora sp. K20-0274 TaxID=3088255 RepID=UPI00399C0139